MSLLLLLLTFAEAHKRYDGMGTVLVIKVGTCRYGFSVDIYLNLSFIKQDHSLLKTVLFVIVVPFLPSMCRFLLSLPTSLVSWLLIQSPVNFCITPKNLRLLYVHAAVFSQ